MGEESSLSAPSVKNWASALWVGAMMLAMPFSPEGAAEGVKLAGAVGDLAEWGRKKYRERARRRADAMGPELDAAGVTIDLESEVDAVTLREAIRALDDALDAAAMPPLGRLLGQSLRAKKVPDGFQRSLARVLCDLSRDELVAARDLFEAIVDRAPPHAERVILADTKEGEGIGYYRGPVAGESSLPSPHFLRVVSMLRANALLHPANIHAPGNLDGAFIDIPDVRRIRDILRAVK